MTAIETHMKNVICGIAAGILTSAGAFTVGADEVAVLAPEGSALLLELLADGVQIYTCAAKESGFEWSFKAPEANLFDLQGRQIGTHFGGPTWKIDDGSAVVGEVIAKADAPEPDAIQWFLLRAKSHEGSGHEPFLRPGTHALLRDLSILQRGKRQVVALALPDRSVQVCLKKRLALSHRTFFCVSGLRLDQARMLSIESGNWHSE